MPSSSRPYQSKILRFVLQQWQQGIGRQERAWRQLQSNTTWGAQVAMFPIYAMVRAVERANLVLGGSHRPNPQAADSPGIKSDSNSHPDSIAATVENATDSDRSIATILAHTETLLSLDQKEQLNLAPAADHPRAGIPSKRGWIGTLWARLWPQKRTHPQPPQQTSAITQTSAQASQLTTSGAGKLTTSRTSESAGELAASSGSTLNRSTPSGLLQNGHTLASMISNRHLVLVRSGNEISDIFTLEQQRDLKSYIFKIVTAYWQARAGATRIPRRLSAKTLLAFGRVSLTALPMELSKAWAQLPPGPKQASLPPTGPSPIPRSRIFLPRSISPVDTPARHSSPDRLSPNRLSPNGSSRNRIGPNRIGPNRSSPDSQYQLPSRSPHAVQTDVHATRYLEHPLEKVLRWLDRILSWCERLWHKLMERRANIK